MSFYLTHKLHIELFDSVNLQYNKFVAYYKTLLVFDPTIELPVSVRRYCITTNKIKNKITKLPPLNYTTVIMRITTDCENINIRRTNFLIFDV